jgi:putative phosphoesterase
MLVALSDTHGRDAPRLDGRAEEAVEAADLVVHAGDYTTEAVLDAFEARCDLRGVYGNNDPPAVRERLPAERIVEWAGLRVAVVHGHEHTEAALAMFGRQSNADLVVAGHSHDPAFEVGGPTGTFEGPTDGESAGGFGAVVPTLNPGSHADPRWNRPAHAELEWDEEADRARGRLVEPSGEVFERFTVEKRPV